MKHLKAVKKKHRVVINGAALAALLASSGCSGVMSHRMFEDSDTGFVLLTGDAEGIRAYNQGLNGLITNTKASPDIKSSYWQVREQETAVRGLKFKRVKK